MDEQEFQQARETLNQCPCPFEKALLSSRCGCAQFQRLNIAEREAAACISPTAQQQCAELLEQLYQNARFALKQTHLDGQQPHGKAMKVQCGGLLGLQTVLDSQGAVTQPPPPVKDINALVTQTLEKFGEFSELPYFEIVKFISNYQVRAKRDHS